MSFKVFGFSGLASCTVLSGFENIRETEVIEVALETGYHETPEQRLLQAVLLRAYMDAIGIGGHMGYSEKWRNNRKREARDWFRDESYEPFTFPWIADFLDLTDKTMLGLLEHVQYAEHLEVYDPVSLEAFKLRFKFSHR